MGEENTQVQAAETQKPVEISPADAFLAKLEEQSKAGNTVPDPKFAQDKAEDPKGEEGQETPAKEEPKEVKAEAVARPEPLKGEARDHAKALLLRSGFTDKAMVHMDDADITKHAKRAALSAMRQSGEYSPEELKEWESKPDGLLFWKGAKISKKQADIAKMVGSRGSEKQRTIQNGRTQTSPNPTRDGNPRVEKAASEPQGADPLAFLGDDAIFLSDTAKAELLKRLGVKAEPPEANPVVEVNPHTVELTRRVWAESLAAVEEEFPDIGEHYRAVQSEANDSGLTDENILDLDEDSRIKLVRRAAESVGLTPKPKPEPRKQPITQNGGIPRPGGPKAPQRQLTDKEREEAALAAATRGKSTSERRAIFEQLTGHQ